MFTARQTISRHRGVLVKSIGDGVLATLDGPARAIRPALSFRSAAAESVCLFAQVSIQARSNYAATISAVSRFTQRRVSCPPICGRRSASVACRHGFGRGSRFAFQRTRVARTEGTAKKMGFVCRHRLIRDSDLAVPVRLPLKSASGPDCVKTAVDDMILLRFGGRITACAKVKFIAFPTPQPVGGDDVGLNRHCHATLGPQVRCLTMAYEITANAGRCEALTVSDIPVYRCTRIATADRDGHAVCAAHSRALRICYYDRDDACVLHG
jgi:hypothetical protein